MVSVVVCFSCFVEVACYFGICREVVDLLICGSKYGRQDVQTKVRAILNPQPHPHAAHPPWAWLRGLREEGHGRILPSRG